MAYVRSSGYRLKDPDDDAALQVVIGDLERLALNLYRGSANTAYVLNEAAQNNLSISSGAGPNLSVTNRISGGGSVSQGFCSVSRTAGYTFLSLLDPIIFDTTVDDADGAYNITTGNFTAPVNGIYTIATTLGLDSANGNTSSVLANFHIYKNVSTPIALMRENTTVSAGTVPPNRIISMPFATVMRLVAGDVLSALGGISNTSAAPPNDLGSIEADASFFTALRS